MEGSNEHFAPRYLFWPAFAVAALLQAPSLGLCQELRPPPNATPETCLTQAPAACDCPKAWRVRVIPYGWLTEMDGHLTVHGETAKVDVSFSRTLDLIFNDLNLLAMGQVEAYYGKCGVIFNGNYLDVSPGTEVGNLNFSTDVAMTTLDLVFAYELVSPAGLGAPAGTRLEALAGFRYNALSAGLTVTGPAGRTATASGSEDWYDAIVGARLRVPLCDCATVQVRGDIGGFDLGDSSKLTWNIEVMFEYRWSERCSLVGGYRWLDIDYERGSGAGRFAYDMLLSGPVLGLAIDF